jgi:hypothetical protein
MALIHLQNLEKNPHHKNKDQAYTALKHLAGTHSTENIHLWAAGSGEGGQEQEDMAYRGLVALAYRCRARNTTPITMAAFFDSLVGAMVALCYKGVVTNYYYYY